MTENLSALWRDAVDRGYQEGFVYGRMGRVNPDGSVSMDARDQDNFVYVTISSERNATIVTAFNPYMANIPGLPVKMRRVNGYLVIKELDDSGGRLYNYLKGSAGVGAGPHSHRTNSGLEYEMESFWLDPGRVLWSGSGATVRVRPLMYRYRGVTKYFAGGTLDLLSDVPATVDAWLWSLVVLNPVTNTLDSIVGAEQTSQAALTDALIANIDAVGYIPLGAVQLREGDTSLSLISRYRDARHWVDDQLPFVGDLTDVSLTAAASDDILVFDGVGWTNINFTDMVAGAIAAAGATSPPDDDDLFAMVDPPLTLQRVTWLSIKNALKTFFDTLYNLYVHPNHTGDVTSVGDGATAISDSAVTTIKIANNAVTAAKYEQIATQRLLGRNTGGAGNVEVLSALPTNIDSLYALLLGRLGGQTLYGGTGSGDDLIMESTSHATKGYILVQPNGGNTGIWQSFPQAALHVGGNGFLDGDIIIASNLGRQFIIGAYDAGNFLHFGSLSSHDFSVVSNNTRRMNFHSNGKVATYGPGSPFAAQLNFHWFDGTTGFGHTTVSVPSGTSVVVIANGTGDVTRILAASTLTVSSGGVPLPALNFTLTPGSGDQTIFNDGGGNTVVMRVTAGGEVQIQRTGGTLTYTVSLQLLWQ